MESIELFEYNQLGKQIEDQTNNNSNVIEITNNYIMFQIKIQYSLHRVAQNFVTYENNLKQYIKITFIFHMSWIPVVLSYLEQNVKFPIFTFKVIRV